MLHIDKMMIYPGVYFIFFNILIFQAVRRRGRVKAQKTVQNDKKFCWSRSISQELYIWLSFMLYMCQIISTYASSENFNKKLGLVKKWLLYFHILYFNKWFNIKHVKKVGHTSEFLFDIYWWTWKTTIKKTIEMCQ